MRKLLLIASLAALAAPLASAQGARVHAGAAPPYGDIEVTFSGSGGGAYRYRDAAVGGSGPSCRSPQQSYTESDSYSWSFSFAVPPGGGATELPIAASGAGLLAGGERLDACAGAPAQSSACQLTLAAPPASDSGDVAYPDVSVVIAGREVTVGALAELVAGPAQPGCGGAMALVPNPVPGWSELQASVSFPRALLARPDGYTVPITMSGAGLWAGTPLSGACDSTACDAATCVADQPAAGPRTACSFDESYSGTLEIRVVR